MEKIKRGNKFKEEINYPNRFHDSLPISVSLNNKILLPTLV